MQAAHGARAFGVRQSGDLHRDGDPLLFERMRHVAREEVVGELRARAVGLGEGARQGEVVVLRIDAGARRTREIDGSDSQLGEGQKLARGAIAVRVRVAPDLQVAPYRIGGVDLAVGIRVPLGERKKPVACMLAVLQDRLASEELPAARDAAIAVTIPDEEPVLGRSPPRGFGETVGAVIEEHSCSDRN